MLFTRLAKRFVLAAVLVLMALVLFDASAHFPSWILLLSLPIASVLTLLYWQTFRGTAVCPTCKGTGKIQVRRGRDLETELCYSCDGEGRVPVTR